MTDRFLLVYNIAAGDCLLGLALQPYARPEVSSGAKDCP